MLGYGMMNGWILGLAAYPSIWKTLMRMRYISAIYAMTYIIVHGEITHDLFW